MKVLLLDTAFSASPIYSYLLEAGHDVWVMGGRPHDALVSTAGDRWINQDYSNVSKVAEHVSRLGIERIVPGCTDVSLDTFIKLKLSPTETDSPETNFRLSNKASFRQLCTELNLTAPRTFHPREFPIQGQYICKPVDSFSGRGITVFDGNDLVSRDEAIALASQESSHSAAVIERFIRGDLYSCSAFVQGEKIEKAFYVREGSSANRFAVDTSYVVHDLPTTSKAIIEQDICRLSRFLGLKDGLLHTQFILEDGVPHIIEVTRRCPGDLYSLLIEYSTDYSYAAKYASYFLGTNVHTVESSRRHILRHTIASLDHSKFGGIRFRVQKSVKALFPLLLLGEELLPRQRNRAAVMFIEAPSLYELIQDFSEFIDRRAYSISF